MSNQNDQVISFPNQPGQAGGDAASTPTGAGQPGNESQPKFLTRAEAEALWDERAKQVEDAAFQRAQSYADKGTSKVRAKLLEVEQTVKRAQSVGKEFTPEEVQRLEQQAIAEAYREEQQEQQPGQPAQPQQPPAQVDGKGQGQELDPINAEAYRIMQATGVQIIDGDPEVDQFLQNVNAMTPYEYLKAVEQAATAKAKRVQQNPAVRMSGLGAGAPAGGDLEAQYQAELAKIPRGSVQAISELKHKYRQKGLNIW